MLLPSRNAVAVAERRGVSVVRRHGAGLAVGKAGRQLFRTADSCESPCSIITMHLDHLCCPSHANKICIQSLVAQHVATNGNEICEAVVENRHHPDDEKNEEFENQRR